MGICSRERPRLAALPAGLAGRAGQARTLALEGFQDEGLIRFDDAGQLGWLVQRRSLQKPMPPAKGGGRGDATAFRRLGQALARQHRRRLRRPAILLAQSGQRRPGQAIEAATAAIAAIAGQAVGVSPALPAATAAMRAARRFDPAFRGRRHRLRLGQTRPRPSQLRRARGFARHDARIGRDRLIAPRLGQRQGAKPLAALLIRQHRNCAQPDLESLAIHRGAPLRHRVHTRSPQLTR